VFGFWLGFSKILIWTQIRGVRGLHSRHSRNRPRPALRRDAARLTGFGILRLCSTDLDVTVMLNEPTSSNTSFKTSSDVAHGDAQPIVAVLVWKGILS